MWNKNSTQVNESILWELVVCMEFTIKILPILLLFLSCMLHNFLILKFINILCLLGETIGKHPPTHHYKSCWRSPSHFHFTFMSLWTVRTVLYEPLFCFLFFSSLTLKSLLSRVVIVGIILSEINQTEDRYHIISLMWNP